MQTLQRCKQTEAIKTNCDIDGSWMLHVKPLGMETGRREVWRRWGRASLHMWTIPGFPCCEEEMASWGFSHSPKQTLQIHPCTHGWNPALKWMQPLMSFLWTHGSWQMSCHP